MALITHPDGLSIVEDDSLEISSDVALTTRSSRLVEVPPMPSSDALL
jgi:hypothetical protein